MVKRTSSYAKSVFLLIFAATVLPVFIFSLVSTVVSTRFVDSIVTDNVKSGLDSTSVRFEDFSGQTGQNIVAIAANLDVLAEVSRSQGSRPQVPGTPSKTIIEARKASFSRIVRDHFPSDKPPVNVYVVNLAGKTIFASTASTLGQEARPVKPTLALMAEAMKRPAGISICARRRSWSNDSYVSLNLATAVLGPSGKPEGFVIADIPRETLKTVLAPLPETPEFTLVDNEGFIALCVSEPEREGGRYLDDLKGSHARTIENRGAKLSFIAKKPDELVNGLIEKITLLALACLAISIALALTIALRISKRISRPVMKLVEATRKVAEGDLSVALVPEKPDDIALLMHNFNAMVADLKALFERTLEEQELLKQAELDSLGSQINPHFFFNALSSISALAKLGACGEINTVTIALGKLLRSSLSRAGEASTLAGSLEETRNYLTIEKIRFADRFAWTEEIGEGLGSCEIPRLGLQTLVENALIHGIEPNPEPSTLAIRARTDDASRTLVIEVVDNGVGIGERKLAAINAELAEGKKPERETHIGLANVNRRIKIVHGDGYGISLRARDGGGIIASMTVPMKERTECTG
jgi:sensor histidine kinase YesM